VYPVGTLRRCLTTLAQPGRAILAGIARPICLAERHGRIGSVFEKPDGDLVRRRVV
jgi:hypothetical protein